MDAQTEQRLRLFMLEFQPSPPVPNTLVVNDEVSEMQLSSPSSLGAARLSDKSSVNNSSSIQHAVYGPTQQQQRHQQQFLLRQYWNVAGQWLSTMRRELQQLEHDDILGHTIIRGCMELADAVAHIATHLEEEESVQMLDNDSRMRVNAWNVPRPLAIALQDFRYDERHENSLLLRIEGNDHDEVFDHRRDNPATQTIIGLLRDIEVALRAVEPDEANDLADAAITVGHLFLTSIEQVHSQMAQPSTQSYVVDVGDRGNNENENFAFVSNLRRDANHTRKSSVSLRESPNITQIPDDDDDDDNKDFMYPGAKTPSVIQQHSHQHYSSQRIRCLWPSLQPIADDVIGWTRDVVQEQPWFVTATVGITCWPVLTTSAVIGGGVVVTDRILQHLYHRYEQHPIIITSEVAAASMYQTCKLAFLTTKVVARPTIRVVHRQLQRHTPIVQDWLVYHMHHPVETVQETATGIGWCCHQVIGMVGNVWQEWQQNHQQQQHNTNDDSSVIVVVDSGEQQHVIQDMSL
jgi:hypothetical protein